MEEGLWWADGNLKFEGVNNISQIFTIFSWENVFRMMLIHVTKIFIDNWFLDLCLPNQLPDGEGFFRWKVWNLYTFNKVLVLILLISVKIWLQKRCSWAGISVAAAGWAVSAWSEVRRAEVGAETGHREWLYTDLVTSQAATAQQQHQPQQHGTAVRNVDNDGVNSISLLSSLNMLEMEVEFTPLYRSFSIAFVLMLCHKTNNLPGGCLKIKMPW